MFIAHKFNVTIRQFFKRISINPLVWFTDNFHCVESQQCYRSKTLSKKRLESKIKQYNIGTILNVREADETAHWYQDEVAVAQKYSVALHTVTLNERKTPQQDQIKAILAVFDTCKKPLLVHCRAGADRTGLVSALWVLKKNRGSLQQALNQQKVWFGHFSILYPKLRRFTQDYYRKSPLK